jgi:hypothetical protein
LEGKFRFLSGIVFKEFIPVAAPEGHLISQRDVPKDVRWYAGLDVGMDHPTVWLLLAIDPQNRVYAYSEYAARSALITEDVKAIKALIGDRVLAWPTVIDPSAYQITKANSLCVAMQYHAAGLLVTPGMRTARVGEHNQVNDLRGRLADKSLFITDACPLLQRNMRTWKYKRDSHDHPLGREGFEDRNNDAIDALRYPLSLYPTYHTAKVEVYQESLS